MRKIFLLFCFLLCLLSLTMTACNTKKPNKQSQEPQSQEEPQGSEEEPSKDVISPVITINGNKEYTIKVGESLTLPSAKVIDDVDGDISDKIVVISANGNKFCTINNGMFTSNVAGVHEVLYCAEDNAQNDSFESVYITVQPETQESMLSGENDLHVLSTNGGVFYENFKEGPNSPLVKGMFKDYYTLLGDETVIAGNSLVIDYSKVAVNKGNKIFLSNIMPYLTSGIWEISFKVKLLAGTPFDELYFAYSLNGDDSVTSYGKKCSLSGMKIGETREMTYKSAIEIEPSNIGNYLFYIYAYGSARNDAVLAFDDFIFKRTDLEFSSCMPSLEDLADGVTFDWNEENYLTLGILENVNSIQDQAIKEALLSSNEFGDTAVRVYSSSRLCGISSLFNTKYFKSGMVYSIRIPYYISDENESYLSVVDGSINNRTVGWNIFSKIGEVSVAEIRFVTQAGEKEFILYGPNNWENLYIGNITISLCEKEDEKIDSQLYIPTENELIQGYTFDFKENNIPELNSEYTDIEYYKVDEEMPDFGYEINKTYFTGDYALRLGGYYSTRISAFDGMINSNNYYKVSMVIYSKDVLNAKHMHLLVLDANINQLNVKGETFNIQRLDDDIYRIEAIVKGEIGGKFISLYCENYYTIYVASISLKIYENAPYTIINESDITDSNEALIDFKNGGVILDGDTYNLYLEIVDSIDGYDTSRENAYLHLSNNKNACALALKNYSGMLTEGQVYKIKFIFTNNSTIDNIVLLPMNNIGQQISGQSYCFERIEEGEFVIYSVSFKSIKDLDYLTLFVADNNEINAYLKSVSIIKDSETKLVVNYTSDDIGNVGDLGATLNISDNTLDLSGSYYVDIEYVNTIANIDESGNNRYLHIKANNMPTGVTLASYKGVFIESKYYKLTLVMSKVTTTSKFDVLFQKADGEKSQNPMSFTIKDIDENWKEYSIEFCATEGLSYLELFDYNSEEFSTVQTEYYIKSINLKMIEADDSNNSGKTPSEIDDESKWGEWR